MRYLVTGGAGFIGSHLVDRLLAEGHMVTVIDDFSSGREENLAQHRGNKHLVIVRRSVTEPLDDLDGEVAAVFHLAAIPSVQQSIQDPAGTHRVNVDGTVNVLELCRRQHARFIFASSAAVYGSQEAPHVESMIPDPLSPYAVHKLIAEQYARLYHRLYGMPAVVLRCFNVFGPRQNPSSEYSGVISKFVDRLKAGQPITVYGDGEQTRDFVFVGDAVEAYVKAAVISEATGQAVNIGTGQSVTINQLVATLGQVWGAAVAPQHGPAVPEVRHSQADIVKARALLGWEPRVGLAEGLVRTA